LGLLGEQLIAEIYHALNDFNEQTSKPRTQ